MNAAEKEIIEKNIIEDIANNLFKFIDLGGFQQKLNEFISNFYHKGIEGAEIQLNMNFVPNNNDLAQLQDYATDNLKNAGDEIGNRIRGEIQRGLLNKESVTQLKERIKRSFTDNKKAYTNRLKTIMRTEALRANEMGKFVSMQQSDLDLKKWLSVILDNRTSTICEAEHKKYGNPDEAIPLNDYFTVWAKVSKTKQVKVTGLFPPFHPNCRTITRYVEVE